jgi:hypothetical protein
VGGQRQLSFHPVKTTDGALDLQPTPAGRPLSDCQRTSAEAAAFIVQRHQEKGTLFEEAATQ